MELHSNLYYHHPDISVMERIDQLFRQHQDNPVTFLQLAGAINAEYGIELAQELLDQVDQMEYDLAPETAYRLAGYSILHFVHGSSGDDIMEAILFFLKSLSPELQVQAWGCGDDDPWEFWLKFEGDELIREDDEPFNDPDEDLNIKAEIYTWWHEGLPAEIKEGFLNEAEADE